MKELYVNCNQQQKKFDQRFFVFLTFICVFSLFIITDSFAQRGVGGQNGSMYNPNTVETLNGEVVSVEKMIGKGRYIGIHLTVKSSKEVISIHLGPEWYIRKQNISFVTKDKLSIKGSRITFEGKPAIIAAEVKKGNETLLLRNENGIPLWSGRRRH